ncbi:/ iolJ / 6-phospho-5-dehydro-2-deoxy-D-gluconate aldolase /:559605 Reverse [Candidatus Hepatoplasma crinochetorum]|uniref:/ iolJ / 6-phospho-5-dehydro-2-deoxy-D-gluconate aldolase /:559605 Reverse n=1 Tax=Candidatus Hepatoplasma crinochetorum TaxID=295596 RepID=A0A0G7ZNE1_9MOLU|nr:/ iolJ / 6-phospho-5-dehydro-2-deoxy-D-gluconate aldolase /:559605 Reverse [Candidatus Hepatoplasma crinochetorum]
MLSNAKKILNDAKKGKYAVGQYNINNLEWTKATLEVCQEMKAPVILGTSEGAVKYMGGFNAIVGMVEGLIKDLKITIPVVLHLDHGQSVENCKKAIDAGYKSVMFDGSNLDINENVKRTKEVVNYANKHNASVEAEVGTVGGNEDGVVGGINYASLKECESIADTGITMLAASLGSVHGHYEGKPKLGFDEMVKYAKATNLPLVLHGGSGIPDDQIKKAIASGEAKINVNTEIQEAFTKGIRKYIEEKLDRKGTGYDPRKVIGTYAYKNMKETVSEKIKLFGTANKAR